MQDLLSWLAPLDGAREGPEEDVLCPSEFNDLRRSKAVSPGESRLHRDRAAIERIFETRSTLI
jgi:hypothetical protein